MGIPFLPHYKKEFFRTPFLFLFLFAALSNYAHFRSNIAYYTVFQSLFLFYIGNTFVYLLL